ncbi:MAG: hypothetical protein KGJ23_04340 [Euryarchaeota archaeon]|nr:hypothetical protein [Euryarchaeota archaeon]MDE1835829.1 hypothetical protein [Euryarchaeota archaeon]MDE1880520.1 hypothetical protein [Euryarchaeota archaeon]MDE2045803.1 hypothetical protein [Thermoplasmata archaeon]
MARRQATSLSDKISSLEEQVETARGELSRLRKEESYLQQQMEKAEGQLRYYEELLKDLRRQAVPRERLRDVMTRM